jgi:hypothetical protein
VFQQWIAEGRVGADSWVWRTGWPDWKAGSEALPSAASSLAADPLAAMAAVLDERVGTLPSVGGAAVPVDPNSAEARRREIKRRKQRVRAMSTALALVALAMLMALVFVLAR